MKQKPLYLYVSLFLICTIFFYFYLNVKTFKFFILDSSNADFRPKVTPDMTSRRSRRLYTNRQRQQLTEAYERCSHLNRETRITLAKNLDLNESDVMVGGTNVLSLITFRPHLNFPWFSVL